MIAVGLLSATLVTGVAACGPAGSGTPASSQPAGAPPNGRSANRAQADGTAAVLGVMRQISRCARSHGLPGFPDPVLNPVTNYPDFPASAPQIPASVQQACMSLFNQLPPQATATRPPTPQYMRAFLRFAGCVRSHGQPGFPDPNALGQFPISGKNPTLGAAIQACIYLVPGGGSSLQFVGAGGTGG
jgi:hypothetical protein